MNNSAIIGTYSGKCCDATVSNNNAMFLSKELFQKLFTSDEFKTAMKNKYYIGFLGHPEDPNCMDFQQACIVMTDCHMDDDGELTGDFDLVDTPVGRIVKTFIDAGVHFGISIRGAGDVAPDGTVDPDTFIFRGFDLVTFPAYDDAVPAFQEIAASTSIETQVKCKKIVSTINKHLSSITSATTLSELQAQFNTASKEYKAIEDRKNELSAEGIEDTSVEEIVMNDKVQGMTNLYLDEVAANTELKKEVEHLKAMLASTQKQSSRKLSRVKAICASQLADLNSELDTVTAAANNATAQLKAAEQKSTGLEKQLAEKSNSLATISAANSKMKSENAKLIAANETLKNNESKLKSSNLKYTQKIEANSNILCERDSTISDLKAKMSETVAANSELEKRASNLEETVNSLQAKIEAAEQMILDYQQAYANMYANALGVSLRDIPVSASTSVSDLRSMISGGTNTSSIAAAPSVDYDEYEDEYEYEDYEDDYEVFGSTDAMVTM